MRQKRGENSMSHAVPRRRSDQTRTDGRSHPEGPLFLHPPQLSDNGWRVLEYGVIRFPSTVSSAESGVGNRHFATAGTTENGKRKMPSRFMFVQSCRKTQKS